MATGRPLEAFLLTALQDAADHGNTADEVAALAAANTAKAWFRTRLEAFMWSAGYDDGEVDHLLDLLGFTHIPPLEGA